MNGRDLISYSSDPDYFNIIQSQRSKIPKRFESSKKYIFTAGLSRSGTTVLGELLNKSSMIAVYTELHNYYRINGYCQSDLSEEAVSKKLKPDPHRDSNKLILAKSKNAKLLVENTIYKALSNDARKRNLTPDELCEILLKRALNLK